MPLLCDRRSFLKTALSTAAALPLAGRYAFSQTKAEAHWALLSDIHIAADRGNTYRGFRPHENLKNVLDKVRGQSFDAMVVNGDLARLQGLPADYEMVTEYLNPIAEKFPLVVTMGNHDDRKNARSAFTSIAGEVQPVEKKYVITIDGGPCEFVLLDSLLSTNVVPGQLGKSQRNWLANYVKTNTSKPAVLFVHHNLDADEDGALTDAERLLAIVRPAKNVKAIIYGHTHAWKHEQLDGIHLVNIPAVGYNFKDSEPVGWTDAYFSAKGARLKLNAIGGNMAHNGETLELPWRS
jgi:3',5'-cyclic AMP phosphodiesterase CpdA